MPSALESLLRETNAAACLTCGKCTAVCPVALAGSRYSPRRLVQDVTLDGANGVLGGSLVWACLTCRQCFEVCPSSVHYGRLMRHLRAEAAGQGRCGPCTHGETIQTWMRMQAAETALVQNRLGWLADDPSLRTDAASDTLYFVGCLPYYDALFEPMGANLIEIARDTVRLLNRAGIAPQVLGGEVCCGHDLLWAGEEETFRRLAARNIALLRESGAKRIVTACAECAYTLGALYPEVVGESVGEVLHISQALDDSLWPSNGDTPQPVTYHDPCRLGRYLGEYDAPRALLGAAGHPVVEMADHHAYALCCGTSAWINCGPVNKAIQVERLGQAAATGTGVLVTACPKCQIHLRCALDDPDVREAVEIEIRDLTQVLAGALRGE